MSDAGRPPAEALREVERRRRQGQALYQQTHYAAAEYGASGEGALCEEVAARYG